jgi:hypothetical protein
LWLSDKVRNQQKIWEQLSNYPAVRHDDFLDALVLLYENAKPIKEKTTQPVFNSRFLTVFNKPAPSSYLASYNLFFA